MIFCFAVSISTSICMSVIQCISYRQISLLLLVASTAALLLLPTIGCTCCLVCLLLVATLLLSILLLAAALGSIAVCFWLSLLLHAGGAVHEGSLLVKSLTWHLLLLLQRHLSALHHSSKWSHIEHRVTHEWLAWSTWSHLSIHLHHLLLERHLPIFSGSIFTHALLHLLELHDLLLLHKHADLSVGRLVELPKLGNLASVSQLHDVLLHCQLWGFFTTLVVLDQIV